MTSHIQGALPHPQVAAVHAWKLRYPVAPRGRPSGQSARHEFGRVHSVSKLPDHGRGDVKPESVAERRVRSPARHAPQVRAGEFAAVVVHCLGGL